MRCIDLDRIKNYPWDLKFAQTQTYEMCIEAVGEMDIYSKR
ncbi:hypothetical protein ACP3VA_12135 [Clostridioides difficile]